MKHILLPTDFSDNSWNAITYAIKLFKEEACTFHLLNTYTPIIYHVEYVLGYPAQFGLGDSIKKATEKSLNELLTRITKEFGSNPNHKFETISRFDTLISGIKEFIKKHTIDLIILGTKGATGAEEVLFGSNTVHVFKEVKCPIMAIPSGFKFESPHEILFPTDLEVDYKKTQLNILREIVSANHSRVNAMHISTGYDLTEVQNNNELNLESIFKNDAFLFHNVKSMNILDASMSFK